MKNYLLFIDTEASGLPKNWTASYSKKNSWPTAIQISWIIYESNGREVKYEDFYVNEPDIKIQSSATKIHGITKNCLIEKGVKRKEVLEKLMSDLEDYQPLVVGHFMELDYHLLAADFYRCNLANPLIKTSMFCTMVATKSYKADVNRSFLKLYELYNLLFNETINVKHNALLDARATAACFFELYKRGQVDEQKIQQQNLMTIIESSRKKVGCTSLFLLCLFITVIIFSFL